MFCLPSACSIMKLNFCSRYAHRARHSRGSFAVINHESGLWSVTIRNPVVRRLILHLSKTHTMARHIFCAVEYFYSATLSSLLAYSTTPVGWDNTVPIAILLASTAKVNFSSALGGRKQVTGASAMHAFRWLK
ncbi:unnamed protein product, partial [Dicrocoelium dendriticum]